MKNLLKISVVIFIASLCLSDCKKYSEDDKCYFFCSPKCRLIETHTSHGKGWGLESVFVNGADSTTIYPIPSDYSFGDNYNKDDYAISGKEGHWSFSNNNKIIIILNENGGAPPLFLSPIGISVEWEIQKLTKNKFWLKTNYNNKAYYLKLMNLNP